MLKFRFEKLQRQCDSCGSARLKGMKTFGYNVPAFYDRLGIVNIRKEIEMI